MPSSWQPLLEGEARRRARQAIRQIQGALPRLPVGYTTASHGIRGDSVLDVGRLGQAVFWTYLAEVDGEGEELERAMECLDAAIDEISRVITNPTLFAGFLGAGWVTEYLSARLGEPEDDPNAEIDDALLQSLESADPRQSGHNLFGGVVGSGVYALERLPKPAAREALERIVELLASSVEERPEGLSWRTPPEALDEEQRRACPQGYFNLGLGHGVPGVVTLLAAVLGRGVATSKARALLEGSVAWLVSQAAEAEGQPTYPRFLVEGREPVLPEPASYSWCFGDPGVAVALLSAARALGDPAPEAIARALAKASAGRFQANGDLADPGFCHGAAGTAHVFHRLFQATGEEDCAKAARHGFSRLLANRSEEQGETGFRTLPMSFHIPMPGEKPQPQEVGGLLRGVAGIGLSLLAAVSDRPPGWDRLMLLSLDDR